MTAFIFEVYDDYQECRYRLTGLKVALEKTPDASQTGTLLPNVTDEDQSAIFAWFENRREKLNEYLIKGYDSYDMEDVKQHLEYIHPPLKTFRLILNAISAEDIFRGECLIF